MIVTLRRNAEASLLVLSLFVALGGYWLASLARAPGVPPGLAVYAFIFLVLFAGGHVAIRKLAPAADPLFLPIAAMLNALGFVLISRLDSPSRKVALAGAQARWLVISVAAFVAVLYFVKDARALAKYRYTLGVGGMVLLLLPVLPGLGREINGARLWIHLGPLNFQPAELGKIALILFFAGYLSERREVLAVATRRIGPVGIPAARHFGPVLGAWVLSMLFMIQEKDMGFSLMFFAIFIVMVWMATARPVYLLTGLLLFPVGSWVSYHLFAHVRTRILVWQHPFAQIHARGYQLVQSLFALATGGAWGTGLGLGRPDLIPNVQTDFIFSALGEELGLAGVSAALCAYALFFTRAFSLATRCRDDFSKLLAAGLATAFALQTLLIVGGVTDLIPLTGVPLPFMSYGGSSLLSNFIIVALLVRVSDQVASQEGQGPPTEIGPAGGGR